MTYLYSQGIGGHHDGRMNAADKRGEAEIIIVSKKEVL